MSEDLKDEEKVPEEKTEEVEPVEYFNLIDLDEDVGDEAKGTPTEFDEETLKEIKEIFLFFDCRNTGCLRAVYAGSILIVMQQNPSQRDIRRLLRLAKKQCNDMVTFDEMVEILSNYNFISFAQQLQKLECAFKVLDYQNQGCVNGEELRHILVGCEEALTPYQVEEMFKMIAYKPPTFNYLEFLKQVTYLDNK